MSIVDAIVVRAAIDRLETWNRRPQFVFPDYFQEDLRLVLNEFLELKSEAERLAKNYEALSGVIEKMMGLVP